MVENGVPSPETLVVKKKYESPLALLFSGIVIAIIGLALWISINSIFEKIRISQGLQQITSIVSMARDAAKSDSHFVGLDRRDLLDGLERSGRIQTDGVVDGVKVLNNPWKNILVALVNTDGTVRIETIVPPHICQRFIGSFAHNMQGFGIKWVEVKGYNNSWRQIYDGAHGGTLSEATIAAGCGDTVQADVALTFTVR